MQILAYVVWVYSGNHTKICHVMYPHVCASGVSVPHFGVTLKLSEQKKA